MTEKQFDVYGKEIVQDNECWAVAYSEYNADVIATALNELVEENKKLQSINQDHRDYIGDVEADFKRLEQHNKELQERNNRQAKQLDKVYKLMEKQDYKALQNIIQDFKEAEELLEREWGYLNG